MKMVEIERVSVSVLCAMKLFDPHFRGLITTRNYAADEPMHPMQIAHYRRMTPAEKLDALAQLCRSARSFLVAGIRMRHPEWTAEEIEREARDIILYGAS